MPSVYNYRHVELDKVGRGKRAIQPPGGQTADIFGRASYAGEQSFSSASSQAGSDVGSASRVHIDTDQQSIASSAAQMPPVDGVIKQQAAAAAAAAGVASQGASSSNGGQVSPTGSLGSSSLASSGAASSVGSSGAPSQQQQLLMAEHYAGKPQVAAMQAAAAAAAAALEASRTPKKTIAVLRRNPITGEILGNPNGVAGGVVRVRQPPGGRSSGIF